MNQLFPDRVIEIGHFRIDDLLHLNFDMNLIVLINFVLRNMAFGLVIGSPNLPVLDDGDVSGSLKQSCLESKRIFFQI